LRRREEKREEILLRSYFLLRVSFGIDESKTLQHAKSRKERGKG